MRARFYCANCQTEVGPKAERCPKCGKFFSFVKCPSCGFEADVDSFLKGCPACGYLVPAGKNAGAGTRRAMNSSPYVPPEKTRSRGLPRGFYTAAVAVLVTALITLSVFLLLLSK